MKNDLQPAMKIQHICKNRNSQMILLAWHGITPTYIHCKTPTDSPEEKKLEKS